MTSVAKLSSVSTIFAGLLRDLRAAPHRHADVGLLQRGRVVHGVAGHRHDLAGLLHQPRQPNLVLGRDPAEHVQLREALDDLVVGELLELGPGDHAGPEAEVVGDRPRGDGVVAGDHPDVDARPSARSARRRGPPSAAGR